MWSSNFQFSDLFYITVGWIASFHIAGVVTLPCGYYDETCITGAYASNPADCTQYYHCDHGKWLLRNCSVASPGACGTPVEYCTQVTCPETTTVVIQTTHQAHSNTRERTIPLPNTNVPRGTTKSRPTTARLTTRGNRLTSESAVASTSASTEGSTVIEKFTNDSAVTIKTTPHKDAPDISQTTTMQIIPQGGKTMSHEGGPSEGGVIAGTVIAVLLVLVIIILGLLWWKRRDMLLGLFNKGKGKNSTNEYDSPYVYQDPHGIKSIKENPTKNNNESSVHIYSEPSKTSPKPTYNGDQSPVLMRNNTLYSAGTDEPFYNTADDPKYDATDSNDYTYTQPPGFKSDTKENHYYTTPGKADDVYYSTVAKEVDGANEQDRRRNGDSPQNSIPQYADVIPRSKRASDPNVADDIDDNSLAREPSPSNQQEPYYFVLENPADKTHYQNTK